MHIYFLEDKMVSETTPMEEKELSKKVMQDEADFFF